jgi:hypothetical protein
MRSRSWRPLTSSGVGWRLGAGFLFLIFRIEKEPDERADYAAEGCITKSDFCLGLRERIRGSDQVIARRGELTNPESSDSENRPHDNGAYDSWT